MSTFNIQVTPQNNTLLVVDNDQNQVVVTNPITSIVKVNTLGPPGPPGPPGASFPYTGSAVISGSLIVTGSIIATQGFTGSLFGTASYALNAVSSQGNNVFQYSTIEDQLNNWAGDIIDGIYGTVNVTGSLLNSVSYSNNFQLFEIIGTSRLLSVLDQTGTNITSSLNINDGTELYPGTYFSAPSGSYFTGLTFNVYNPNQKIKLYYTSPQPQYQQNTFFTTSSLRLEKNLVVVGGITGSLFGSSSYARQTLSSSFALTASYALNGGSGGYSIFQISTVDDQLNNWAGDIIDGVYGTMNVTGSLLNSASYLNNFQLFEIVQTSRLLSVLDQTGTNITSSLNINDSTELYAGTYFSAPSGSYFTGLTFNVYNPNQEVKLYYTSSQPQYQQNSYFVTSSLRLEKNLVVVEGITGSLFGSSSYALTASFALNGGETTVDTGSFVTTSSFNSFTSSINTFTSSYNTGSFTGSFSGSFVGNGSGLTNIPASGITGLNLSQIATGSISASVSTGTGSFTITSGSSNFLFVSSSGNVGIGTNNPASQLDLVGQYKQTRVSGIMGLYHISTANADQVRGVWDYFTNTAATPDFFGRFGFKFEGGTADSFKQYQIHVADSTTPKMVVNGAGNIGIGTTAPTSRLQARGSGTTSATTTLLVENSAATNLLTVLDNGQFTLNSPSTTFTSPLISLATSQSAFSISHSISASNQVGGQYYGVNITPTFFSTTASQTETAFRVAATFTGSAAATGGTNIIADFGATSAGSQLTVTDVTSGSIYMVNDVSGLPIIEATSDWTVKMYNFPQTIFEKTGSQVNINGTLRVSGSFILPLSQSVSPQTGSAYWSGSLLFVYDGTQYRSSSFA